MSAQVEPILKLFIACRINDNFDKLDNNKDLIISSIKIKIIITKKIVLKELSNKKEIKLLVK